jgi:hypothetical protein
MEEIVKLGGLLGLEGKDLKDFVEQKLSYQKNEEREERAKDREMRKIELEHELEIQARRTTGYS